MELPTIAERACGECNACCKVFAVPEVGKLDSNWCPHCAIGKGCLIYDSRPGVCRSFACAWLRGDMGDDFRPDKVGIMVHRQDIHIKNRLVRVMHIWEMRAGVFDQPMIAGMIKENETAGHVIVLRRARDERSYSTSATMNKDLFTQDEAAAIFAQLKGGSL